MKIPQAYFDSASGGYWLQVQPDKFLRVSTEQLKLWFQQAGLSLYSEKGLGPVDLELLDSMKRRHCDFVGPLAGHGVGLFVAPSGVRVLVTSQAMPVKAERQAWEELKGFLAELVGAVQLPYLLGWLKFARQSLLAEDFRPGQVLVLAGPSGCGKSLLQALVTAFLGGRCARPYRYMVGQTAFNADLAGAEHLVIEDEHANTCTAARRRFGASIKEFTVVCDMSIHGKGREARMLPVFHRLSISVNSEPENLMILPPLDDSILDKVILLRCQAANVEPDRLKNWKRLADGLPGLAYFLEHWTLPHSLRDRRFGVGAYHEPSLLELISDVSPETRLLNLVDQVILWAKSGEFWRGTAEELECKLVRSDFKFSVEKLLYFPSACGVYLARLAQRNPARFRHSKSAGKSTWMIYAP